MAVPRLNFLYPHLFKPIGKASSSTPRRSLYTSISRPQQELNQPSGSNVEPPPPSGSTPSPLPAPTKDTKQTKSNTSRKDVQATKTPEDKTDKKESKGIIGKMKDEVDTKSKQKPSSNTPSIKLPLPVNEKSDEASQRSVLPDLFAAQVAANSTPKPLETVLHLPGPSAASSIHKPPHLQAPPYVHHFDTYTLVRSLERGGFPALAAVTTMKAVRSLLAENLALAKDGLVSKSDVENESYLFRAACSELRTEIKNARQAQTEAQRVSRAQLHHEADILSQRMTQELATLRDDVKGMFDDRKMTVREEQRRMDRRLQEINYKITVDLNSDMKSEVEGLRWVLTRRAAIAIVTMACLILGSLRVSRSTGQNEEKPPLPKSETTDSLPATATQSGPASDVSSATLVSLG